MKNPIKELGYEFSVVDSWVVEPEMNGTVVVIRGFCIELIVLAAPVLDVVVVGSAVLAVVVGAMVVVVVDVIVTEGLLHRSVSQHE